MLKIDLGNQPNGTGQGNHGEVRHGIIMPGPENKLVGHIHRGWHLTLIHRGQGGVIRTPAVTLHVREGDWVEIDASEKHELEALFGPIEYFCTGVKGF